MSDEAIQVWVRNEKAKVFGPLAPTSVELLLDNGIIQGRVQVSTDGINYVFPGRVPGLRMIFPKELWGPEVVPGDELDAQWSQVALPPALPSDQPAASGARPAAPPGGPVSSVPGGPVAAPRGGPVAGPGARAQQQQRPMNPAQLSQRAQPRVPGASASGVVMPPGARMSSPSGVTMPMSSPSGVTMPMSSPSGVTTPMSSPSGVTTPMSSPSGLAPAQPDSLEASLFDDVLPSSSPSRAPVAAANPYSTVPPSSASGVRPAANPYSTVPPSTASAVRAAPSAAPAPSTASAVRAAPPSSTPSAVHAPSAPPAAVPGDGAMPPSGQLAQHSATRLYYLAAAGDLTGLLTLTLPDRVVQVHFKKGNPEFVDSNHPQDALQAFLVQQQLATAAQIEQAEREKARFGGDLIPALFGLGLINPNVAFQQLAGRAASILGRALLAEQGAFTFQPMELPAGRSMPIGNKWAVFTEQLRRTPNVEIRRRLHAALDLPIMKSGGLVPVEKLALNPQEARALTFFDGVRSLNQLIADLPQDADVIARTAWMLRDVELVSFAATPVPFRAAQPRPAAAPPGPPPSVAPAAVPGPPPSVVPGPPPAVAPGPPPAIAAGAQQNRQTVPYPGQKPSAPRPPVPAPAPAAPAAAAVPAPPPRPVVTPAAVAPPKLTAAPVAPPAAAPPAAAAGPASGNHAAEVMQLTDQLAAMKKQNYFEVLGVKRDADASAVKIAYFKLAKNFHPDTVPPGAPDALAKAKADIFALVGEANRTLSDPKLKADYLAEVDSGTVGEKVDVAQILMAEELFQKGCILVKARKFPEAVKMLDDAIKANGEEPEFYAWRGFAKFFTIQDKSKAQIEANKDISHCTSRNPNVAASYYFLGFIAKQQGDLAAAKKHFKKCVDLDSKHIDAQRELRMMSGAK